MRAWSRLDRAVAREIRGPMMLGLLGFSLVLLLNYLFILTQKTIERRVPFGLMIGFVLAELPRIIMFTIPMAMLLAVLVGIGRMATQSEVIAMRSAGISPYRLFKPVVMIAAFWTVIGLACSHVFLPIGRLHERELVRQIIRVQDVNREIDPGVFYDKLPGAVLYAKGAGESAQGRVFRGILLYRESPDGQNVDLILARRGRADFDPSTGRRSLLLDQGEWHRYQPARPDVYDVIRFDQYTLPFPADPSFQMFSEDKNDDPHSMTLPDLYTYYSGLKTLAVTTTERGEKLAVQARMRKAGLEWHRRWALPLAAIGLALVGFPLAVRSRRGGRFAGLSQALMIIFVFWLALSTGWGLSEQGKLPVWFGPWVPDLIAVIWAAVLWLRLPAAERGGSQATLVSVVADAASHLFRRRRPAPTMDVRPETGNVGHRSPARWSRRFTPGRLDLFLGTGYLKMFAAVLFVLVVIAAAVGFRSVLDEVDPQAKHFPWGAIIRYIALATPAQLRFMVPIAVIFGATISLSGLARTGEITALKAAGIGPVRMALTLLTITTGIAIVYATAQETILPAAARESQRELDRVRGKTTGPELLESGRRWLAGEPGHIWNYIDWDAKRHVLLTPGLLVVDLDNAHLEERIQAGQAQYTPQGWVFSNGWRRELPKNGTEMFRPLTNYTVPLRETADLFGETRSRLMLGDALADQLTFTKLWHNYRQSSRTGYPSAPLLVGLNEKLIFPLLPLGLLLAGIPLAVSGWQRKGSLFGFGISILIIFFFWVMHAVSTSLGREGVLNPVAATWLPTVLLVAYGSRLLARAR